MTGIWAIAALWLGLALLASLLCPSGSKSPWLFRALAAWAESEAAPPAHQIAPCPALVVK